MGERMDRASLHGGEEGVVRYLRRSVHRKRDFGPSQIDAGNLKRCLSVWDLVALGVGSTLGVGVYVVVGAVARGVAGPAVVASFLVAGVAALFAGLCYAEFGSRVPRAGSAYIYTYVIIGEFPAFMVGWNAILEALFSSASIAKGFSVYVDSLLGHAMSRWFAASLALHVPFLAPYFDLFAFLVVIIIGAAMAYGVKESTKINNVFAVINLCVIIFVIIAGSLKADPGNWSLAATQVPAEADAGVGGFLPWGVGGMLRGAAICFYGFVGFENISASSEEVKNPSKSVPIATILVMVIAAAVYAGVSTVVTMMVPYYLQDKVAAVATAFSYVGWEWARWVVSIGAIFGLCASLFGSMFPLPRLLYAMSSDGLLLPLLARVTSAKTPVLATLMSCCIIAALSAVLSLEDLILMSCIGTLLSYTIVAACVVLRAYKSKVVDAKDSYARRLAGLGREPTRTSYVVVKIYLLLFIMVTAALGAVIAHVSAPSLAVPAATLNAAAALLLLLLALQPKKTEKDAGFKTPLVPLIPCLSIYVNVHLMMLINIQTWIRILVWIVLGIPLYLIFVLCYKRKKDMSASNKDIAKDITQHMEPEAGNVRINTEQPDHTKDDKIENVSVSESDNKKEQVNLKKRSGSLDIRDNAMLKIEEVIVQNAVIDYNDEKEAKIIDLLDQVIQAEEEAYGKEPEVLHNIPKSDDVNIEDNKIAPHRKSLSELSEAGSDASSNIVSSNYDVVAQVHREDLPKVSEEPEVNDTLDLEEEHEKVTFFNESETSSRTDESGYSDTTDYNHLSADKIHESNESVANVPPPPPINENLFASAGFQKSYTISVRSSKPALSEEEEEHDKPRESVLSNSSHEDNATNIVFGSKRQKHFMSKLNDIFQNKRPTTPETDILKRSCSMDNLNQLERDTITIPRPLFLDLKKELLSKDATLLRPVIIQTETLAEVKDNESEEEEVKDVMSREDLKCKLENLLATGGPKLLKPRLMKSNPPTPEEAYQTDSSTESLPKPLKVDKNDTLKRQKDKFGDVLNAFRSSLNIDSDPL